MMYFVSLIPENKDNISPRNKGILYLESMSGKGIYRNYDISSNVYDAIKNLDILYFGEPDFKVLTDIMTKPIDGGEYYELIRLDKTAVY